MGYAVARPPESFALAAGFHSQHHHSFFMSFQFHIFQFDLTVSWVTAHYWQGSTTSPKLSKRVIRARRKQARLEDFLRQHQFAGIHSAGTTGRKRMFK